MSVKTIFKVLFGTILALVLGAFIVEMINISVVSLQLTQLSKIACRQAAVLFSQETYKQRGEGEVAGGSVNMDDVKTTDGTTYAPGNFYGEGKTASEIYNSIYTSDVFKSWLQSEDARKGNWESIELINRALNDAGSLVTELPGVEDADYEYQLEEYSKSMLAQSYADVLMTPLNMGVPYLDRNILQKMFQWNLSSIVSGCSSDVIVKDDGDESVRVDDDYAISYNGFRVYGNEALITNLAYKVYDLSDGKDAEAFQTLTGIRKDYLLEDKYSDDDERQRICVVGIEYKVPMTYVGITPIRYIFNWAWNNEVEGLKGSSGGTDGKTWNSATAELVSGGFGNRVHEEGVLPVPGKLIYYIVR